MKIYIAASYPRRQGVLDLCDQLIIAGHSIVSSWVYAKEEGYDVEERMEFCAIRDLEEIKDCDVLICLTDGENQLTRGGRHTELGIALALEKQITVIGELESVFHYHPKIEKYENVGEFLDGIKRSC